MVPIKLSTYRGGAPRNTMATMGMTAMMMWCGGGGGWRVPLGLPIRGLWDNDSCHCAKVSLSGGETLQFNDSTLMLIKCTEGC